MIRLTCLVLLGVFALGGCGEEEETGLIRTSDFGESASEAEPVSVGIPGTPPCRSLREFTSDLNLDAVDRFSGTSVDLKGHGQVFAVLFDSDGTPPSASERFQEASRQVDACIAEVKSDPTRRIENVTDLPESAVGIHATENGTTTDYAFALTADDRLLVVGDQYSSSHKQPVSLDELLGLALERAEDE